MAAWALFFLVLVLLGYYYYTYIMPKSCKVDTDCTAPKTCLSGSCAAPGGAAPGGATGTAQPEVYYFDNGRYAFGSTDDALTAATAAGLTATIASVAQINDAQKKGASWCDAGWDADGQPLIPSDGSYSAGSGCSTAGVIQFNGPPPYGANLYGVKPAQSKFPNTCTGTGSGAGGAPCVLPFNNAKWSQYS